MQYSAHSRNFSKLCQDKRLAGPQVMLRSQTPLNEANLVQKRDVRLWESWQLRSEPFRFVFVGLVTAVIIGALLEGLPIFSPGEICKRFGPKLLFFTATKNSPFNLKMIISRNRSLWHTKKTPKTKTKCLKNKIAIFSYFSYARPYARKKQKQAKKQIISKKRNKCQIPFSEFSFFLKS